VIQKVRERVVKKGKDAELSQERKGDLRQVILEFLETTEETISLPSDLTGLERKFIHQLADEYGLSSQSAGVGTERYIALFKPDQTEEAEDDTEEWADEGDAPDDEIDASTIQFSGLKIDNASRALILGLGDIDIPTGWTVKCRIAMLCKGGLSNPEYDLRDRRSEIGSVVETLKKVKTGKEFACKVVSFGKSETSIAVGLLLPKNLMSTHRTPHITIAKAPDAPGMIASRSIDIQTWIPVQGISIKGNVIQHPKGDNYIEPEGEASRPMLGGKRDFDNAGENPAKRFKGKDGKGKGKGKGKDKKEDGEAFAANLLDELEEEGVDLSGIKPAKQTVGDRSRQGNAFRNMLSGNKAKGKGKGGVQTAPTQMKKATIAAPMPGKKQSVASLVALTNPWEDEEEPEEKPAQGEDENDDFLAGLLGEGDDDVVMDTKPAGTKPVVKKTAPQNPQKSAQALTRTRLGLSTPQKPVVKKTSPPKKQEMSFDEELLAMCGEM